MEGQKEVLGLWVSKNEGAKFWLSYVNELRTRGEEDILIACVSNKDRKVIEKDLKTIYKSVTAKKAEAALGDFKVNWNGRYPIIGKSWREKRQNVIPFFAFPEDVRKVIVTKNSIESTNMSIGKMIKNRGHFQNEEAMSNLIYLTLRNIKKKWTKPIRDGAVPLNQFAIVFGNRVSLN